MNRLKKIKQPVVVLFLVSFIAVFAHSEFGAPEKREVRHFQHDYRLLLSKKITTEESHSNSSLKNFPKVNYTFKVSEYPAIVIPHLKVFLFSLNQFFITISLLTLFQIRII